MTPLLEVANLSIAFGGLRAVDDVSFEVRPGQIVSVIGPNGAGKTTLFNMISGLYRPTQGSVRLVGADVTSAEPHLLARRGLARTFQNLQVFPSMTLLENVMVGHHLQEAGATLPDLFGLPSSRRKTRATAESALSLLARVGLEKAAFREALTMSYGALKRLEIARALALRPKILLLDEPAAGCNAVETEEIDQLITEIASSGVAILLVEHDMKLVMKISSHIIALDHGRKIAEGNPGDVAANPDVIAAYLGQKGQEQVLHADG
ncbi:MAG: ABC transporter ATP-binding protein [Pararhodobacter sp.]|nr:ABC transporter ATP-binding protein [Pararhodobacter sp.]